jgi:hypothetical protein
MMRPPIGGLNSPPTSPSLFQLRRFPRDIVSLPRAALMIAFGRIGFDRMESIRLQRNWNRAVLLTLLTAFFGRVLGAIRDLPPLRSPVTLDSHPRVTLPLQRLTTSRRQRPSSQTHPCHEISGPIRSSDRLHRCPINMHQAGQPALSRKGHENTASG